MIETETSVKRSRLGGLWKNKDFLKLWGGQAISEIGSHITRDGVPLLAVITLGASSFQMGLLSAISGFPILLVGLFAGVWVDRLRRRPVMILADLLRALLLVTIPLAAFFGVLRMEQLYIVMALVGIFTVIFDIAYMAYLPFLVERSHVLEGNSKLALSSSLAELSGPGLAGLLVQVLTAPIAILLDSISFLVSVISVAAIRKPEPPPALPETRQHALAEIREGLQVVFHNPLLRSFAFAAGTRGFFGSFFGVLYGIYGIRELGLTPVSLGLTIAMGGAGDLLGALFAAPAVRRFGLGRTLVGATLLSTTMSLLIPLAGNFRSSVAMVLTLMFASQLFGDGLRSIYTINEVSLRQAITPDRLLGRVNASMNLFIGGIEPIGALVGGFLGGVLGTQGTLWVAALGGGLSVLWLIFSPIPQLKDHETISTTSLP